MGYELISHTGKTMLIKHSELKAACQWAGLGFPGPGFVDAATAAWMAEGVRLWLPMLDDVTPEMAAEGVPAEDLDKPRSDMVDAVPHRSGVDPKIMAQLAEIAEEGPFEVCRIPEA